jgi:hypothetical protein
VFFNILRHELPDTDRSIDVVAFEAAATVNGASFEMILKSCAAMPTAPASC